MIEKTAKFCNNIGIDIKNIINSEKLIKIKLLGNVVDSLVSSDKKKNDYLSLANQIKRLSKSTLSNNDAKKIL